MLLIVLTTREGHCDEVRRYLVGETPEIVDSFFKEVCLWCSEIRSEILVFADAYWRKDELLYNAIKGTSFDEIVLRGDLKDQIRRDIARFLTSREAYERYRIPWKRGLLFLGPPGNGKTQMVKAIANEVGIPVLYVKSFKSEYRNDHHAIHEAFKRARQAAPCLFVLEDLDTLVDEGNRSFFLNEMDGFASNTGLITLATANHPERLDPAILDRPSRFDRKFVFDLPGRNERVAYLNVWNAKLESELRLSESGIERVAEATEEFSYAYLKELVLSAMMSWMEDGSNGTLEPQMLELAPVLRSHMKSGLDAFPGIPIGDEDDEEDGPFREFSSAELSG